MAGDAVMQKTNTPCPTERITLSPTSQLQLNVCVLFVYSFSILYQFFLLFFCIVLELQILSKSHVHCIFSTNTICLSFLLPTGLHYSLNNLYVLLRLISLYVILSSSYSYIYIYIFPTFIYVVICKPVSINKYILLTERVEFSFYVLHTKKTRPILPHTDRMRGQ